tara:strand:+ start:20043 stop:20957 length:915 start_codon:yes stop_codon:yes gene_type:complete
MMTRMRETDKVMKENTTFVAIDWSGSRGQRHRSIAVARCGAGTTAPHIVLPVEKRGWSRRAVLDWILALEKAGEEVLIGFDFSFSLPFLDYGAYLPGLRQGPEDVAALWRFVEEICADAPDYYAGNMAAHPVLCTYFHRPGHRGDRYERRLRQTEIATLAQGAGRAESVFHLIGPSQVGLGSFAGMRMLRALKRRCPEIAIWPWDKRRRHGVTLVEIYTRAFLALAGRGSRKIRNWNDLDQALARLGSGPVSEKVRAIAANDHLSDAILSAAGLRHIAESVAYWKPQSASPRGLKYEGWTFGIR